MRKEFYTITEVLKMFQVEERFVADLEEGEILCPTCADDPQTKLFFTDEIDKLRFAKTLIEDMGVNLAGVEVTLHMRRQMVEMRKQFDSILEDLSRHIQERMRDKP